MPGDPVITSLLRSIDEAFDRRSWHGTNLRGSIRGLGPAQAAWRPARGRHSAWEIVLHAAYWKYAVRRRLTGEKRGSFPLEGSNWFRGPERPTEGAWKEATRLLVDEHRRMRAVIEGLPPSELGLVSPGGRETHERLVRGIAAHDLYHAGQIQLLKRLMPSRRTA
ncbi:MAG TPA: DinB family protein [Vicinamibacteria bacterium]|nr:DinB family protein [Vicinamibacteria bacterium]